MIQLIWVIVDSYAIFFYFCTPRLKTPKPVLPYLNNILFRLALAGYISYIFLFCCGWLRELLSGLGCIFANSGGRKFQEKNRVGYAPLYSDLEIFYTGHVYHHLKPVFCQQINSCSCAKGPSD